MLTMHRVSRILRKGSNRITVRVTTRVKNSHWGFGAAVTKLLRPLIHYADLFFGQVFNAYTRTSPGKV